MALNYFCNFEMGFLESVCTLYSMYKMYNYMYEHKCI